MNLFEPWVQSDIAIVDGNGFECNVQFLLRLSSKFQFSWN